MATNLAVKKAVEGIYAHLPKALIHYNDIIIKKGQGSWVWTTDDQKYLDFTSGIGATSTGHCHPRVVKAVQEQAAKIVHAQQNLFAAHDKMIELVDKLLGVVPSHLSRFLFCNSGAEAVENAVKIARVVTGRQHIIAFEGGYHGRTMGTMPLTSSKTIYRQHFGPLMPGAFITPYPYCLHCKVRKAQGGDGYKLEPYVEPWGCYEDRKCCDSALEALDWMFKMQTLPEETAAIIIEPILGEGGFLTPPPSLLKHVRELCDKHGILLIFDEVQSGVGRTGQWWGHQHLQNIQPDLMTFAKGIASGYPFAGVAARDSHFDKMQPGQLGGTYGGNAVSCAAAVATIDTIIEEDIMKNVQERGLQLMGGLLGLAKRFPIIDVRGRGLMVAAEFGGSDGGPARKGVTSDITKAAARRHMLLMGAGARETIRFLPPLVVTKDEVDLALHTLEESCAEVFGKA